MPTTNDDRLLPALSSMKLLPVPTKMHDSYCKLLDLDKRKHGALSLIASFLCLNTLAQLARTNKSLRSTLNSENHLWLNTVLNVRAEINNKHDLLLQLAINRQPKLALVDFARQNPLNAYQIIESKHFSQKLPERERKLTSSNRGGITPILHGFLGGLLGFSIGLTLSLYFMLKALLRTLLLCLTCCAAPTHTSFARSFLGWTLFPFYSLCASVGLGAYYGWKYELNGLGNLKEGLQRFHHELYHGTQIGTDEVDPWYCWDHDYDEYSIIYNEERTHLPTFFKAKMDTVADTAAAVRQKYHVPN